LARSRASVIRVSHLTLLVRRSRDHEPDGKPCMGEACAVDFIGDQHIDATLAIGRSFR